MIERLRSRLRHNRRRASIYVAVLGYAAIVTVIGLSALLAIRVQRRSAEGESDLAEARLYARSAIELGMWLVNNDPNWRSTQSIGAWATDEAIGTGTYSLEAADPNDSDLANSITDSLLLTSTGSSGVARHRTQVTLEAEIKPLGCLEVALHAGGNLNLLGVLLQSDYTISANGSVNAISAGIEADVQAVLSITGATYYGSTTSGIAARTMPDSAVFDDYLANGTSISIFDLPSIDTDDGTRWRIREAVLSPASNPYGATTNAQGIYVIDCMNQEIRIEHSCIVGTLVLLNPSAFSAVKRSVNWQPAIDNYPALLVRGSMAIEMDSEPLSESLRGTNFNPPGTPYLAVEDSDEEDDYPSMISGLIYVSENLSVSKSPILEGVTIVGQTLTATDMIDLTYKSTYFDNPPPGFFTVPRMLIAKGSWKQVVD